MAFVPLRGEISSKSISRGLILCFKGSKWTCAKLEMSVRESGARRLAAIGTDVVSKFGVY